MCERVCVCVSVCITSEVFAVHVVGQLAEGVGRQRPCLLLIVSCVRLRRTGQTDKTRQGRRGQEGTQTVGQDRTGEEGTQTVGQDRTGGRPERKSQLL